MNKQIERLYQLSQKNSRLIMGLMSGTSLDGLDVALCEISGSWLTTKVSVLHFETIKYERAFQQDLLEVFSKETVSLQKVCLLNAKLGSSYASIINDCLKKWKVPNSSVDLIASHGQTIYHAPATFHKNSNYQNGTMQIGDGDHIAVSTGIITISDFRQKHIAAGGEGAPLAGYGDYILFGNPDKDVILINIGGISNLTFIPKGGEFKDVLCTDIGPGNKLMDEWIRKEIPNMFYDQNGTIGLKGKVNEVLLKQLLTDSFFHLPLPKSTGPERFNANFVEEAIHNTGNTDYTIEDVIATLNMLTAIAIAELIRSVKVNLKNADIYCSGGGIHNPLLMDNLRLLLDGAPLLSTEKKHIHPDAKEAVLFALLANECVAGDTASYGTGSHHFPSVLMGKISMPA